MCINLHAARRSWTFGSHPCAVLGAVEPAAPSAAVVASTRSPACSRHAHMRAHASARPTSCAHLCAGDACGSSSCRCSGGGRHHPPARQHAKWPARSGRCPLALRSGGGGGSRSFRTWHGGRQQRGAACSPCGARLLVGCALCMSFARAAAFLLPVLRCGRAGHGFLDVPWQRHSGKFGFSRAPFQRLDPVNYGCFVVI